MDSSITLFLYQKLVQVVESFLFSVFRILLPLFSFISSFSFKKYTAEIYPKDFKSLKSEPEWDEVGFKVSEANTDEVGFTESENDCEGKKLVFRFPSFEEFSESKKENNQLFNGVETEKNEATNLNLILQETGEQNNNSLKDHEFCEEVRFSSEKDSNFGDVIDWPYSDGGEFLSDGDFEVDADALTSQFLSEEDFRENSKEAVNGGELDDKEHEPMNTSYDSEKLTSKKTCDFDRDSNKLETLWEHQDLIEQLRMELRKVRTIGLPTILEESESPKITDNDLKPRKIDDIQFQHEDCMDELHKFYRSYTERMRNFDIFSYQKMYAIGFLQLNDPIQPIPSQKTSGSTFKSRLSQNFWQLKHKRSYNEPMIEFMKELQSDLEVVYVGQMCLSWEFLHWQYGKALDLWDSDPHGIHRYNEVAGEFQQFQVLMQRFTEDEHLQGPRVQYYIKRRCILRNLLQVPVITEDNLKDKRKGKRGEKAEYVITSDMLVEIIEESIRVFWQFVRADKDCSTAIAKGHKGTLTQLQNPGDSGLLMEIKKDLQKKERKLKDSVRSGRNCILRIFQKCREDDSYHVLYFFSQVDMKLVSRVLNMSRITSDQLIWCHGTLSRISFENRKSFRV
ncbi:hypothetical protein ACH5RR_011179 [Cinchona calisaya]|uniref:Ribosomal protein L34Ae n=1 Tax=Cinchona calisaya TaxID=153742 RepID=A0ABD3A5N9_9GENT